MAELRSFIIGVTIAGAILLVGGLAFGLFGDNTSGSPTVKLLETPPATRTPAPPATRDPSQITPVVPTPTLAPPLPGATDPAGAPSVSTPVPGGPAAPQQTPVPSPTPETAPTQAPTQAANPVTGYIDAANSYTPALMAQLEYLIGNANAPSLESADWRTFTLQSAQNIQGLAGGLASISAPACVSGPHGQLAAAANQASAAAGEIAAAVNADNAGGVAVAAGSLNSARDAINSAVASVSNAVASSC